MVRSVIFAAALSVLAIGCDRPETATTAKGAVPAGSDAMRQAKTVAPGGNVASIAPDNLPADRRWAAICPMPSDAPEAPLGQASPALMAQYGAPADTNSFVLGEAFDPVRMSIRNTLSEPHDLRREVREMIWRAQGCELRVWLAERGGRWVAIQTMRAPAGGEH